MVSVILALILIAFIPIYDLYIKGKIDSVEVAVVKPGVEIAPTEKITKDKITVERRRKQDLIDEVIYPDDIPSIIGYDAADLMVGNAMISSKMIDYDGLIPDESKGESIRPIVDEMIYAKPGSLRRKDTVDMYIVKGKKVDGESNSSSHQVVSNHDSGNSDPINTEEMAEEEKADLGLSDPILTNVKVVYAKDSSNQEVTNTEGKSTSESDRLHATGTISNLEVILNEEDFQLLMEHVVTNNDRLYITYN